MKNHTKVRLCHYSYLYRLRYRLLLPPWCVMGYRFCKTSNCETLLVFGGARRYVIDHWPHTGQACAQMRSGAFKCKCKSKKRIKCKCKCKCSASESNANGNAPHRNQMQMHLDQLQMHLDYMQTLFSNSIFCCVQQVIFC